MATLPLTVTASILSADLSHLQDEVDSISSADAIQVDVMDGHFVPNLSFGAPILKHLQTDLPFDIHLMVENPADRVQEFFAVGSTHITFHAEAVNETEERKALIQNIRDSGATAGIALNPDTPVSNIEDVVSDIDLVLVMSVHPGFAGQAFLPAVLEKVKDLRGRFPHLSIQMDGGIDDKTAALCREAGANNLVAASHIFRSEDREKAISSLRR